METIERREADTTCSTVELFTRLSDEPVRIASPIFEIDDDPNRFSYAQVCILRFSESYKVIINFYERDKTSNPPQEKLLLIIEQLVPFSSGHFDDQHTATLVERVDRSANRYDCDAWRLTLTRSILSPNHALEVMEVEVEEGERIQHQCSSYLYAIDNLQRELDRLQELDRLRERDPLLELDPLRERDLRRIRELSSFINVLKVLSSASEDLHFLTTSQGSRNKGPSR